MALLRREKNAQTGSGTETGLPSQLSKRWGQVVATTRPRIRELRHSLQLMRRSPLAMAGLIIVLVIIGIAVFAPLLAPTPEGQRDPYIVPKAIGKYPAPGIVPPGVDGYIMGTGEDAADIYYGVIWGARTSINIALFVVGVSLLIGVVLGAVAGFYGGWIDDALMRITDVFLSLPSLILAMAVVSVLGTLLDNIMLALVIVWWPPYARLIRGQVLSVRENTYVEAARAIGCKRSRILFRHIVPNSLSPVLVSATMDIGAVVLVAAGLSYIGFGPPDIAEWGRMVSAGQSNFVTVVPWGNTFVNPWWMVVFPGLMIFLFVMGFSLLGDGLRDVLDPRLRR